MMRAGDSTASVGLLISRELVDFTFSNCYLQGKATAGELTMNFPSYMISGVLRYLAAFNLFSKFWRKRPDVILAHRFKCLHFGSILSLLLGCPLVVVVHGIGEYERRYRKRLMIAALKKGAHVVCVSGCVEKYIHSVFGERYAQQIHVIHNSINYERVASKLLPRAAARKCFRMDHPDRLLIAYVGRLAKVKGVRDFVEAACCFDRKDVQFVLAGDGPLLSDLKVLTKSARRPGSISFLGFVPEAVQMFRGIDLLVMPSRSEGFPITLLEAMAAEVPVLVSDIEVYREILGNSGAFYEPENIGMLVDEISRFIQLSKEGRIRDQAHACAARVRSGYPYVNFVGGYAKLLHAVLK
jgi:glycosyltransferase involved in cell wall biosynthesis